MGLFSNQFSNVVEWEEYRDDLMFWKWSNKEIKKGSKLIIRPGQDAIFMYNGKVEGVFKDEGSYDIESQIIPFLSTLKGFKFGFNSGIRAEVLFINTKEFTMKWGTQKPVYMRDERTGRGIPIRALGNFSFKLTDYMTFIDKIAGVKQQYSINEAKERIMSILPQELMKWIAKEGKDIFNLQATSDAIAAGIQEDLDMDMSKIGIEVTNFAIGGITIPEEMEKMMNTMSAQDMVDDVNKYQRMKMTDAMAEGKMQGGGMAADMMSMQMGMMMGQQMMNNMNNQQQNYQQNNQQQNYQQQNYQQNNQQQNYQQSSNQQQPSQGGSGQGPKFCPECGTRTNGAKFCPECGTKLV